VSFTWIVPDRLGACPYPEAEADWVDLGARDVRLLVNLHTRAHRPAILAQRGVEQQHLPVTDLEPPSPEQIEAGLAAIDRALAQGQRVAVHCGAGLGRTGTLLACYLVRRDGLAPEAAIARIRAARPGSIETPQQAAAIIAFAGRASARSRAEPAEPA
jgi:atypical dual specificity phosphatase